MKSVDANDSLDEYLKQFDIERFEGYSAQVEQQVELLKKLASNNNIKNILEIGFNAGHSAEIFLSSNKSATVTSFDVNRHKYTLLGKDYIDQTYPKRHTLITGNSLVEVPKFTALNPDTTFDLIFIDGGHQYHVAKDDIKNCCNLAHADTIVIMDDTINNSELLRRWNDGPNKAWKEAIDTGMVNQLDSADWTFGRGCSWGNYIV